MDTDKSTMVYTSRMQKFPKFDGIVNFELNLKKKHKIGKYQSTLK